MLTKERLKSLVSYDKETGVFSWLKLTSLKKNPAGTLNSSGYYLLRIDGVIHYCHRLAFLYEEGRLPIGEVDHIDGNRSNNAFLNLREVTRKLNACNQKLGKNNTSGFKGVGFRYGMFYSRIVLEGKRVTLGKFEDAISAARAYDLAMVKHYGECAMTNFKLGLLS